MGVIETNSSYKPPNLKVDLPHPVPVVETASLSSLKSAHVWLVKEIGRQRPVYMSSSSRYELSVKGCCSPWWRSISPPLTGGRSPRYW